MSNRAPLDGLSTRQIALQDGHSTYYGSDCRIHGRTLRFTSHGMCVKCKLSANAKSRVTTGLQEYPHHYYSGRNFRSKGYPKTPPAILSEEDRYWWLAGWNDRDVELMARKAA